MSYVIVNDFLKNAYAFPRAASLIVYMYHYIQI